MVAALGNTYRQMHLPAISSAIDLGFSMSVVMRPRLDDPSNLDTSILAVPASDQYMFLPIQSMARPSGICIFCWTITSTDDPLRNALTIAFNRPSASRPCLHLDHNQQRLDKRFCSLFPKRCMVCQVLPEESCKFYQNKNQWKAEICQSLTYWKIL